MEETPAKRVLRSEHFNLEVEKLYSVFVFLRWSNDGEGEEEFDEHIISMKEEGGEWSDDSSLVRVNEESSYCVVYPLKPETTYEFRMKGKKSDMETKWSEVLSVKTEPRTVIPEVDEAIRELRDSINDENRCIELLGTIFSMTEIGGNGEREDEEEEEEDGNEEVEFSETGSNFSFSSHNIAFQWCTYRGADKSAWRSKNDGDHNRRVEHSHRL